MDKSERARKKSARGEESSNECMLCGGGGGVENTMHVLFDCPEYPELVWEALKDALNAIAETENIIFDKNRVCAHWIILCKKVISYSTYQRKYKK